MEDYGWLDYVSDGDISGTTGESRRLEAIKIRLSGDISDYYDVNYRVYCQNIGWLDWTSNGKVAGTVGGSYKLEAIQIKLSSKSDEKLEKTNKSSLTFSYKNGFKVCYDANGRLCKDLEGILGSNFSDTISTFVFNAQLSYIHLASSQVNLIHPCEHVVPNLLYSSANNVYGSCSSYGTEWNKILLTILVEYCP